MSAGRITLSVFVALGAVLVLATVLVWLNLSHLSRNLVQRAIPGLDFAEIKTGWNKIEIRDFAYASSSSLETSLSARSVEARPAFLSFFKDEIEVSRLAVSSPEFYMERKQAARTHPRTPTEGGMAERSALFTEIVISDGKGEFVDHLVDGAPARFALSDIDIRLSEVQYPPKAGPVGIDASANIEGKRPGRLELSGWVDTVNNSAEISASIAALDLRQLDPYLKAGLESLENAVGKADLQVQISMLKGDYRAWGEIVLSELRLDGNGEARSGFGRVLLREYLRLRGNRIQVPFEVSGNIERAEHRLDVSALLSGVLRQEIGSEALEERLGAEGVKEAEKGLRQLRDRAREFKDLFR